MAVRHPAGPWRRTARLATTATLGAVRLALAVLVLGFGYDLADRLLTRLTLPVAILGGAALLAFATTWIVIVRTGRDLTRLQARHENDQYAIKEMDRAAARHGHELARLQQRLTFAEGQLNGLGHAVTLPPPRAIRFAAAAAGDPDETTQPGGAR